MPQVQRSSDVVETHAEHALAFGIGAVVALALGGLFIYYQGMLTLLGYLLVLGGLAAGGYAVYCALQIRKVTTFKVECPMCHATNVFLEQPMSDVSCRDCHRLIPIVDGRVLRVYQVRCGFCNRLNYYSDKSPGLICEECDREIPLATSGAAQPPKAFTTYARHDDDKAYDLVLIAQGHKTEELISCLQHMLALNRNQVKDILTSLPATLMTGIPRKKAEMLAAQISLHEAAAEIVETAQGQT